MDDIERLERVFKALANKKRLELLKLLLGGGEMSVVEISERLGIPYKTVSRNLNRLQHADLVTARSKRNYNYYHIQNQDIHPDNVMLLAMIKRVGQKQLKDSKAVRLISAAMFTPYFNAYMRILSGEDEWLKSQD